jgi:hypothetical protein
LEGQRLFVPDACEIDEFMIHVIHEMMIGEGISSAAPNHRQIPPGLKSSMKFSAGRGRASFWIRAHGCPGLEQKLQEALRTGPH